MRRMTTSPIPMSVYMSVDREQREQREQRYLKERSLFEAAASGDLEKIKEIAKDEEVSLDALDRGQSSAINDNVDLDILGGGEASPICWAAANGHLNVVKFLYEEKNVRLDVGDYNLLYAAAHCLDDQIREELVAYILETGLWEKFNDGTSLIHVYSVSSDSERLKQLLNDRPDFCAELIEKDEISEHYSYFDKYGVGNRRELLLHSPLTFAAAAGIISNISLLLERDKHIWEFLDSCGVHTNVFGESFSFASIWKTDALTTVVRNVRSVEAVGLLLDNGADIDGGGVNGISALSYTVASFSND